ncbi:DUF1876 domain-containing protein [Streptomyces sp. ISL-11]|uniref:DUF1876 domain-containing protein n=1 Tax=Streptomyces sp. ISL-11 TaxID=2819174 RepID=UPI001BEC087D|nr:DUF1876 domain-containing protein [Streptomyces sp. ISL-11]MBT2382875.1 DUF1876 domain-containing protein [Streptomyces sp. ISL-11]
METIVKCNVEIEFREAGALTQAAAVLRMQDGTELTAHGVTNRHPDDPGQQRVGEEVAAARALHGLVEQLLEKAGVDIEEVTHTPAHLTH